MVEVRGGLTSHSTGAESARMSSTTWMPFVDISRPVNSGVKLLRVVERDLERFKLKRQATVTSVVKSSATARVHRLAKSPSGKTETAAPHPKCSATVSSRQRFAAAGREPSPLIGMRGPPSPQHPREDLATLAASCLFRTTCAWLQSGR
jgi:hypothetical protein